MKAISTFLLFITFFFYHQPSALQAQNCSPDNIILATQMEVDDFQSNHGACDHVVGSLTIKGADITNLNGLSGLASIGNFLVIRNCNSLVNTSGLSNVVSIGGGLQVFQNPQLTDLSGLSDLSTFNNTITIQDNSNLDNLNGL